MGSREYLHDAGAARRSLKRTVAGPLALLLFLAAPLALAANIYRYVDENGRTVFNSSIPPQYASKGYTVLDERGRVLQEVPRAPTAQERAALEHQRELERLAEAERERQLEADRLLVRLYRSPEEIARKRDERLEQLNAQLTALSASLGKAEEEARRLGGLVAGHGEAGSEVPEALLQQVEATERQVASLRADAERISIEVAETEAGAARDMARLTELLGR